MKLKIELNLQEVNHILNALNTQNTELTELAVRIRTEWTNQTTPAETPAPATEAPATETPTEVAAEVVVE